MTNPQDFTKTMQDMMSAFPMDTSAMQDAWKTQAAMAEKLSRIALQAAEQSTEISARWAKGTIGKMGDVATVRDEASDYQKAMTDFASAQAESTSESLAAFAEIAKRVQMETVELMLAAGKDLSAEAAAQGRAAQTKMAETMVNGTNQMAAKSNEAAKAGAQTMANAANK